MQTKINRKNYLANFESEPKISKKNNFLAFMERFPHRFFAMHLDQCEALRPENFRYKLTKEKSSIGLINCFTCDPCQIVFQGKPFEIKQPSVFFVYILSGDVEVKSSKFPKATLTTQDFVMLDSLDEVSIKAEYRVSALIGLISKAYLQTHTDSLVRYFENLAFTGSSAAHQLFSTVVKATIKSLNSLPIEVHDLVIDGMFFYLRPLLKEVALIKQLQEINPRHALLAKADQIMLRRLKETHLQIKDVATDLGISSRYLSQIYKDSGTTVQKQLMLFRLRRADVMLKEGHCKNLSIEEIAKKNGFAQVSHFSRAYKQEFNITPTEARMKNILR